MNPPAYRPLDDGRKQPEEVALPSLSLDAHDLEEQGFGDNALGVVSEHESRD